MKILTILTLAVLLVGAARAADKDQALFERNLEEARKWVQARKDVRLSRSHYGPSYHKGLSVIRDAKSRTYVDYYWTMGGSLWAPSRQYPFNFSDVLVRFDVSRSQFRLIYYQPGYAGKHTSEQDGADQPATAPESKPEGNEKPKPESEGRSQ